MIFLITGKTGSGKSYETVTRILQQLDKGRKVYTNIKLNVIYENYFYLDEIGVRKYLKFVGDTFSEVENLELKKEYMKTMPYFDSDFFIDEAHLVGFREKKESILNWLTIHRHFNQNVYVITQVPQNLHRDYLGLFHEHIEMIPANKRLAKNSMGYRVYDAYKGDRVTTTYFKPNAEIFELYNSGNKEQGVNKDVFRLGALLLGMALLLIYVVFYLSDNILNYGDLDKVENKETNFYKTVKTNDINRTKVHLPNEHNVTSETIVMCSTIDGCYYNGQKYTYDSFLLRVKSKDRKIKSQIVAILSSNDRKEYIVKFYK